MKKAMINTMIIVYLIIISTINIPTSETTKPVNLTYEETYEELYTTVYFKNLNSNQIIDTFNSLQIEILSITPIKFKNIDFEFINDTNSLLQTVNKFTQAYKNKLIKNSYSEEALYFEQKGIPINNMKIRCTIDELTKLQSKVSITEYE